MTEDHNRDIEEVDRLVAIYKSVQLLDNPTKEQKMERNEALSKLLEHFSDYFEKYIRILMGDEVSLRSRDSFRFMALFLTGKDKNLSNLNVIRAQIHRVMQRFERDDIYNELVLIFITLLDKYKKVENETGMVNYVYYLTMLFRFRVKDWFNRLAVQPLMNSAFSLDEEYEDEDGSTYSVLNPTIVRLSRESFNEGLEQTEGHLDLSELGAEWVVDCHNPLFKTLTKYDRYLLYNYYGLGLSIRGIAEIFGRDEDTIWRHMTRVLTQLRSAAESDRKNAGERQEGRFRSTNLEN